MLVNSPPQAFHARREWFNLMRKGWHPGILTSQPFDCPGATFPKIGFDPRQLEQYPRRNPKKMLDEKLLPLIQCPISGQSLQISPAAVIAELNEKIARRQVRDASDQLVESALDQGLTTADGARLYPVGGGIPTLIADAAIELEQG